MRGWSALGIAPILVERVAFGRLARFSRARVQRCALYLGPLARRRVEGADRYQARRRWC